MADKEKKEKFCESKMPKDYVPVEVTQEVVRRVQIKPDKQVIKEHFKTVNKRKLRGKPRWNLKIKKK